MADRGSPWRRGGSPPARDIDLESMTGELERVVDDVRIISEGVRVTGWHSEAAIDKAVESAARARDRAERASQRAARAAGRADEARSEAARASTPEVRDSHLREAETHEDAARLQAKAADALRGHARLDEEIARSSRPDA